MKAEDYVIIPKSVLEDLIKFYIGDRNTIDITKAIPLAPLLEQAFDAGEAASDWLVMPFTDKQRVPPDKQEYLDKEITNG